MRFSCATRDRYRENWRVKRFAVAGYHAVICHAFILSGPVFCCDYFTGDSANAVPHTKKLRTRVTHIWGNRRRQPNRSAMEGSLPGRTALLITVSPVPGKYDSNDLKMGFVFLYQLFIDGI